MKVRHKETGVSFDLDGFEPVKDEPIPEEQWVDVTAECEVSWAGQELEHKQRIVFQLVNFDQYRLRKVTHGRLAYFLVDKKQ